MVEEIRYVKTVETVVPSKIYGKDSFGRDLSYEPVVREKLTLQQKLDGVWRDIDVVEIPRAE